ncbi:MAG: hypothetical protein N2C12_09520 [Planctomycetales bacterium]
MALGFLAVCYVLSTSHWQLAEAQETSNGHPATQLLDVKFDPATREISVETLIIAPD